MKKTLELLWDNYLADECARVEGEEERRLLKEAARRAEALRRMLTEEVLVTVEAYAEALCKAQAFYAREMQESAFFP